MSPIVTARQLGTGIAAMYRRYAEWLVSITWKRFIVLSIVLMIASGILTNIPPFTWDLATKTTRVAPSRNVDIQADGQGVRITPKRKSSQAPEIIIDEHGIQIRRRGDAGSREIIIDDKGVQMRGPDGTTQ